MDGFYQYSDAELGLETVARTPRQRTLSEGWAPAFRTENVVGSTIASTGSWGQYDDGESTIARGENSRFDVLRGSSQALLAYEKPGDSDWMDHGWTPAEHLETLGWGEQYKDELWAVIHDAGSPAEARESIARWDVRRRDRETLANMSFRDQLIVSMVAGMTDPIALAAAIGTGGAAVFGRGIIRAGGILAGVGAAEQGVIEGILSYQQPNRTLEQSLANMAASATIAGIVGGGFAAFGSKQYQQEAVDNLTQSLEEGSQIAKEFTEINDLPLPFSWATATRAERRENLRVINKYYVPGESPDEAGVWRIPTEAESVLVGNTLDEVLTPKVISDEAAQTLSANVEELTKIARKEGVDVETLIQQRLNQYIQADIETGVAGKGQGAIKWINMTGRLANSPFASVRALHARLSGTALAQNVNVGGKGVGTKRSAPMLARIETLADRHVGLIVTKAMKYKKDFYGSGLAATKADIADGSNALMVHITKLMRSKDGKTVDGRAMEPWEVRMRDDVINIDDAHDDSLYRGGYFAEVIKRGELDYASLSRKWKDTIAKFEAKKARLAKSRKTEEIKKAELSELERNLKIDTEYLTYLINLAKKAEAPGGNKEATMKLVKVLHGDRRYVPQSWNKSDMIDAGMDQWAKDMVQSNLQKMQRIADETEGPERAYWLRAIANFDPKAKLKEMEEIYKKLVSKDWDGNDLTGMDAGLLDQLYRGTVPTPDSAKIRQLMVDQSDPNTVKYMNNNYFDIMNSHDRSVIPYMELKREGMLPGTTEANLAIKEIRDEASIRGYGKSPKERAKIEEKAESHIKDIEFMIQLGANQVYKDSSQATKDWVSMAKSYNDMTKMGMVLIASIGDIPGSIVKNGVGNFARAVGPALRNQIKAIDAIEQDELAALAGVFERSMNSTAMRLNSDIDDGLNAGRVARRLRQFSSKMMKIAVIQNWNQLWKEVTLNATMDRLLKFGGGNRQMGKWDATWMANNGWSQERLERLWAISRKYPADEEGANAIDFGKVRQEYMKNPDDPTLRAEMDMVEELGAFLRMIADRVVVTPGKPDLPNFVYRHPTFSLATQYKSFGFASTDKTLGPMIQAATGNADPALLAGFVGMTMMGSLSYYIRQKLYDREVTDSNTQLLWEGILRGGALGLFTDGLAISQKATGNYFGLGEEIGLEGLSRYYARDISGDLFGPTVGSIDSFWKSLTNISNAMSPDGEWTEQNAAAFYRLIPYNNLFYLRALMERY